MKRVLFDEQKYEEDDQESIYIEGVGTKDDKSICVKSRVYGVRIGSDTKFHSECVNISKKIGDTSREFMGRIGINGESGRLIVQSKGNPLDIFMTEDKVSVVDDTFQMWLMWNILEQITELFKKEAEDAQRHINGEETIRRWDCSEDRTDICGVFMDMNEGVVFFNYLMGKHSYLLRCQEGVVFGVKNLNIGKDELNVGGDRLYLLNDIDDVGYRFGFNKLITMMKGCVIKHPPGSDGLEGHICIPVYLLEELLKKCFKFCEIGFESIIEKHSTEEYEARVVDFEKTLSF